MGLAAVASDDHLGQSEVASTALIFPQYPGGPTTSPGPIVDLAIHVGLLMLFSSQFLL